MPEVGAQFTSITADCKPFAEIHDKKVRKITLST
jgi:hypothetical protein